MIKTIALTLITIPIIISIIFVIVQFFIWIFSIILDQDHNLHWSERLAGILLLMFIIGVALTFIKEII